MARWEGGTHPVDGGFRLVGFGLLHASSRRQRAIEIQISNRRVPGLWNLLVNHISPRNAICQANRPLGRGISKYWSGYQPRGKVEARARCLVALSERITGPGVYPRPS